MLSNRWETLFIFMRKLDTLACLSSKNTSKGVPPSGLWGFFFFNLELSYLSLVPHKQRWSKVLTDIRSWYGKRTLNLKNVDPNLMNTQIFLLGLISIRLCFELVNKISHFLNIFCSCPITNKQAEPHSSQILPVCTPVYTCWVEIAIHSCAWWAW